MRLGPTIIESKCIVKIVWHGTPRPIWALGLILQLYSTAHGPNPRVQN